jgi:DNA-binding NarL/FixJ family response regulator
VSSRPRVLLADDHAGITAWLRELLSEECDVVGAVSDGSEVVAAAVRLQPVVVVVDLNLPTVNGFDVCRQILRDGVRAKAIVITAMADEVFEEEALQAGAAGFFPKAAAGPKLVSAIKQIWAGL